MKPLLTAALALTLTACGGSGGGSESESASQPTAQPVTPVSQPAIPSVFGVYTFTQGALTITCTDDSTARLNAITADATVTQSGSDITLVLGSLTFTGTIQRNGDTELVSVTGQNERVLVIDGVFSGDSLNGLMDFMTIDFDNFITCRGNATVTARLQ